MAITRHLWRTEDEREKPTQRIPPPTWASHVLIPLAQNVAGGMAVWGLGLIGYMTIQYTRALPWDLDGARLWCGFVGGAVTCLVTVIRFFGDDLGLLASAYKLGQASRDAEIANLPPDTHQPYVGTSSFAHKAGLHASALRVDHDLYNHIDPTRVGNDMRVLVTEMAGRASVELKGAELGIDLADKPEVISTIVEQVKDLESEGWTFEAADASFELLLRDAMGEQVRFFTVESWRAIVEQRRDGEVLSEATVKVHADGERIVATGEGNGPVNALDRALRQALSQIYPQLEDIELADYKVRIVEGVRGTDAVTRVLVGNQDGSAYWTTVGVHDNVVAASWMALQDAINFGLLRRRGSTDAAAAGAVVEEAGALGAGS